MRVLFCKIHCPSFICFCKSSSHIYTSGPLKLENSPHVPSTPTIVSDTDDHHDVCGGGDDNETFEVKDESGVDGQQQQHEQEQEQPEEGDNCPKSSLKKVVSDLKEGQKKKVQWMDFLGKELVEIKEFEPCEIEEIGNDNEYRKGCVCTIL